MLTEHSTSNILSNMVVVPSAKSVMIVHSTQKWTGATLGKHSVQFTRNFISVIFLLAPTIQNWQQAACIYMGTVTQGVKVTA